MVRSKRVFHEGRRVKEELLCKKTDMDYISVCISVTSKVLLSTQIIKE